MPGLRMSLGLIVCGLIGSPACGVDLVKAGKPVATVVSDAKPEAKAPAKGKARRVEPAGDAQATRILVEWLKKITDAELPVADKPGDGPAIYVGKAAVRAGLKLDDINSPTKEGVRIVVEANRVLIAGQSEPATVKAVCRFLEHLGCRYFMDGPLGEVFPRTMDLSVEPTTIAEKPGLLMRNPKGPSWRGGYWKEWNGAGGEEFHHQHSWGRYIPKGTFEKHPEYFAMGADGRRKDGDWLCTSNPAVREMFAEQVISVIKSGTKHPSISPPDGRGYCQCEKCKAQDDPKVIEPSSGTVAVSNRYADFFEDVARRVAKAQPDSVLSFYVYADYTQPPSLDRKLSPNLCAVIAPIRYCRLHAMGDPICPSRKQQVEMVDGWAKVASRLGYYNYMYNLADATLPMFKYTPCRVEFPALADRGLAYMTIEVLSNWHLYGPQIYLSLRLAYDPKADVAAIMDDYFDKFYGPAAKPMKAYWMGIDEATAKLDCHSGGFYGLAAVYTPEFVRACQSRLQQAAEAGKDVVYLERIALSAAGFRNVIDYLAINEAMARGDFPKAKDVFDGMVKRNDDLAAKGHANREYATAYLKRFLQRTIDGGVTATAAPNKVAWKLPDRWRFIQDDADEGLKKNFHAADFDDSKWKTAATYSATLSQQGLRENSVLWYRTTFRAPDTKRKLTLLFPEVDGLVTVYANGKELEPTAVLPAPVRKKKAAADPPAIPRRSPFEVDVTPALHDGDNVVAVRVDNRRISELFLGGILRPVVLVEKAAK
jgi:Domain of unknown function (DUF4838)/Beta-galactosidase second all-beta domain